MVGKNYHLVKNKEQDGGYIVPVVALRSSSVYGYPVLGAIPVNLKIVVGSHSLNFDIPHHLARSLLRYMYQIKNMRKMRSSNGNIDVIIGTGGVQYRETLSGEEVSIIFAKLADLSEGRKPRLYINDDLRATMEKVKRQLEELLSQKDGTSAVPL